MSVLVYEEPVNTCVMVNDRFSYSVPHLHFRAQIHTSGMPGFRWEMVHDLALAKEVAARRPEKPVDWIEITDILNTTFSTEEKPVLLKGRGCKDRLDLLLKKYKDEESKSLKK